MRKKVFSCAKKVFSCDKTHVNDEIHNLKFRFKLKMGEIRARLIYPEITHKTLNLPGSIIYQPSLVT
jgi:hypothetical protein